MHFFNVSLEKNELMTKLKLTIIGILLLNHSFSQSENKSGDFGLGVRTTLSLFDNTENALPATGFGGCFKIRLNERVNTDWFADYIYGTSMYVNRVDYHIGWSVMYYLGKDQTKLFQPFAVAGHCFDLSQLTDKFNLGNHAKRWSSAVQGGFGVQGYLSDRLSVFFQTQYMIHLGSHLEAKMIGNDLSFDVHKGSSLEGHLLTSFTINYQIGKLWGR
jgi:hypothetical protein